MKAAVQLTVQHCRVSSHLLSQTIPSTGIRSGSCNSSSSSGGGGSGRDIASQWEYGTFKYGVFGFNNSTIATAEEKQGVDRDVAAAEAARRQLSGILGNLTSEQVEVGVQTLSAFVSAERLQRRSDAVKVVFESPSNPNNVWAALRTCDSFGVHSIDLIGWQDGRKQVWRRDQMNAALGAQKYLSIHSHDSQEEALNSLRGSGYKILVTDVNPASKSLFDYDFKTGDKVAIVFGNELNGASAAAKALADDTVFLPMRGFAESLNLSVSVAVALTHVRSQGLIQPNLSADSKSRILLEWLCKSVRASLQLLQRVGLPVHSSRLFDKLMSG